MQERTEPSTRGASGPFGANPLSIASQPPGMDLAISVDTLVSGVHFPSDTPPADIAYKALAVNLSDMAAMGARPDWAVMSLTLPRRDADWIARFREGFGLLAGRYGVRLLAWDMGIGHPAVTIQIHGQVPPGLALRRDGARPGDQIFVTGTLGDAGLALAARADTPASPTVSTALSGGRPGNGHREEPPPGALDIPPAHREFIDGRLARPTPRVAEGMALRGIASAAIDVSDGLAADLSHIVEASSAGPAGLRAVIHVERLPLSPALGQLCDQNEARHLALSAGDDYELCFTVPPEKYGELLRVAEGFSCPITCLGHVELSGGGPGIRFLASGEEISPPAGWGYRHFA